MRNDYLIASCYEKRIESAKRMALFMRVIVLLPIFALSFCCINSLEYMKIPWCMMLPIIWVFFGMDVSFLKKSKAQQFLLYQKLKENMEVRQEVAGIRGEVLPDHYDECLQDFKEPEKEMNYLYLYYGILTIVNIAVIVIVFCQ